MKVQQRAVAVKHSNDELFSDTFPTVRVSDCRDGVKDETRKGDDVVQKVNKDLYENVISGSDVVFNHRVVETGCGVKKDVTVGQDDHEGRPKRDVSLIQAAGVRDRIGE